MEIVGDESKAFDVLYDHIIEDFFSKALIIKLSGNEVT